MFKQLIILLLFYLLCILAIPVDQGTFEPGTGPALLSNVDCFGTESSLLSCIHSTNPYCSHLFNVGVVCPSCKYLVALFPGSPALECEHVYVGRACYLSSREHDIIKIGPEFLEQKSNALCVGGLSKIQTLCHMTQVEVYSGGKTFQVIKIVFLHLQRCRFITS